MKTNLKLAVPALLGTLGSGVAMAAADPLITAGITTAGTAFTDNFGAVFSWFVGIVVTLSAAALLVKYIRKAK